MMYRIGVELDGTSINVGLVDGDDRILGRVFVPFSRGGAAEAAAKTAGAISALTARHGLTDRDVTGIGVVLPDSMDLTGEAVPDAHRPASRHVPFKALLQEHFTDVPVFLANDAYGAVLAESRHGALRGCKTAALLLVGEGVGGGVVLNGSVFSGGRGHGIELGHIPLVSGGEPCRCGGYGCAEAYCSAAALTRDAVRAAREHPESALFIRGAEALSLIDPQLVLDCAKEGDPTAMAVFDRYVDYLTAACLSVIHLLDPEVIAIGGWVCHAGDFLFQPLCDRVWKKNFFKSRERIVPASLGADTGMLGAALLVPA